MQSFDYLFSSSKPNDSAMAAIGTLVILGHKSLVLSELVGLFRMLEDDTN
jgi:hypothetical protein